MEIHWAYCSACDRQVRVMVKPGTALDGPFDPESVVCLEHGDTCTGSLCPLFAVPSEQMKKNLEESGLVPPESTED